jgi:hypothetical protein
MKALSQHFLGGTEKNHKNLGQESLSPDQDLNQGSPKYKKGI